MNAIHALAFLCGFISLSVEILWVRFIAFAQQGEPRAFGFVLSAFLVGIAFGALHGKRHCQQHAHEPGQLVRISGLWLVASGLVTLAGPLLVGWTQSAPWTDLLKLVVIIATSFCTAVVFPIVHHLGVDEDRQDRRGGMGRAFSGVYVSNVLGATLGPLVCNYGLIGVFGTQTTFVVMAGVSFVAGLAYVLHSRQADRRWVYALSAALAVTTVAGAAVPAGWLLKSVNSRPRLPMTRIVETRQGIISLHAQPEAGDVVFGGNVYDGTTNLDLDINSNGLHRLLLLAALHEKPRRVLMVGMSIGSWLALVRAFAGVESIDVVEINPGYLAAMRDYPRQAAALTDPRVDIRIDDGRRWLRQHPQQTYDLVIMNTTFHWRNNTTLLLSKEFLTLIRARLNPGGLLALNATGSVDVLATAAHVFTVARRYENFIYAADWDFTSKPSQPGALQTYRAMSIGGQKLFAPDSPNPQQYLALPFYDLAHDQKTAGYEAEVITDWNMVSEYRHGRR